MFDSLLRVDVLGTLRARLENQEIGLGPARQRALFALLADRCGRVVPRDELIEGVWGASPPASVDGNVHTYISGLRRVLEPDRERWSGGELLVSDPPGYRLRLRPVDLDLMTFRCLKGRADEREAVGDYEGAVHQLDSALALWRGEAFNGVLGPYAERRRAELAEERLAVISQRVQNLLVLGEHHDLVPELEALAQEHPLREPIWEALITALLRSGRRLEALDHVAHVRSVLREHLGVEPGATIQALHQQLLADEPDLGGPAKPRARRPEHELLSILPAPVAPLVGRDLEQAKLRTCVDEVRTRRGHVVFVEGEKGIGKTALLSAVLGKIRSSHRGWADGGSQHPLAAALGIGAVAGFNEVLKRVEQLCATAPLVLAVDDLHAADAADLLLWDQLSAAAKSLPLLLIASCEPGRDRLEFARLRRAATARDGLVLHLRPLGKAAVARLVLQETGAAPGPALRSLVGRALGNPLVLKETVRALVRDGAVRTADGVVDLVGCGGEPTGVERARVASMNARLDHLSPTALDTLRSAAVLGMRFTTAEIAGVVQKSPSQLLCVLDEAIRTEIIVQVRQNLAFCHPAQRRALYDGVPCDVLADLHRRAARVLAEAGAPAARVCDQLAAVSDGRLDPWVTGWLVEHEEELTDAVPFCVLNQALYGCPAVHPHRAVLLEARARVLRRFGSRVR